MYLLWNAAGDRDRNRTDSLSVSGLEDGVTAGDWRDAERRRSLSLSR